LKKLLLVGAIVAIGAVAGTYVYQQQNTTSAYNVLDYIPADTAIFSASLEPFPIKNYIASAPKVANQQNFDELVDAANPGINFALSLLNTYQSSLGDGDKLIKTFGLADDIRAYVYTLGLQPVLKIEIANEQAIWDLLDKTELETQFQHQKGTLRGLNYRRYAITDETDPTKLELIIAINHGLLTITVNSHLNEESHLAMALGLDKSDKSLANTPIIDDIIKNHHFKKEGIAFINHIELIKGLTTKNANLLAKQITALENELGESTDLSQIRNEQCATEFSLIAQNWPQTVAGYTDLNITAKESNISTSVIVESKNQTILNALSLLRGFIPNYVNDLKNNVLAVGFGLDINQLSSSLNNIWSDLQTPNYQCQPLAQIQSSIKQSGDSIAMVGMSASMANGVQGVSFGLLDYTMSNSNNEPKLDSLDALLTLSAENPALLFNTVKMFLPELQQITLTPEGEVVELSHILPIPKALNIAPKLAIKGKHLVIYNGELGAKAAEALSNEELIKNGMLNFSFDFKKMMAPVITTAELTGETIPEEMMFLSEYDTRVSMSMDINQQGLIFNSSINNKASK
tara:strand:- start:9040 stop:10761 length:1722 start_codon:yes stop_codon:yes gene_type:complete